MPKYVYRCDECEEHFEIRHSMNETIEECEVCGEIECLTRVPQMMFFNKESRFKKKEKEKPGSLVKEYIEKNREVLKNEKKEASKREYES